MQKTIDMRDIIADSNEHTITIKADGKIFYKSKQSEIIGYSRATGIIEPTLIFGVDKVGQDPYSIVRTDMSIGLTYNIKEAEIYSDFDSVFPWSEMEEYTDSFDNVFIKIPKFYSKITQNADGTYKHQLSNKKLSGYDTLFKIGNTEIDYVLVGKYEAGLENSKFISKSGKAIRTNTNITNSRTYCKNNGSGYQMYDYMIDGIIKELFLIEFATTDSQSIMKGYTSTGNAAMLETGHTDDLKSKSGSWNKTLGTGSNTSGTSACMYRGIENPWGNANTFCDGINLNGTSIFLCTIPSSYNSNTTASPYTLVGTRPTSNGKIVSIDQFASYPLLGFVASAATSPTKGYFDAYSYASGARIIEVGGNAFVGDNAGLWCIYGQDAVSYTGGSEGARLCYKPPVQ